jgi:heme-degrading monooxygenase HmoA
MKIARHWTGVTSKEMASAYIRHLQNDTFKQLILIKGFIKASILQRHVDAGVEFLIVTEWENMEAIKTFAGSNPDIAVVPKIAQDMMMRFDKVVRHYEIMSEVNTSYA